MIDRLEQTTNDRGASRPAAPLDEILKQLAAGAPSERVQRWGRALLAGEAASGSTGTQPHKRKRRTDEPARPP